MLFVPVEENEKVFLYEITSWTAGDLPLRSNKWRVNGILPSRLQNEIGAYFEETFSPKKYPGITVYNCEKRELKDLTASTFSIYLGLFIEMFKFVHHRSFKSEWNSITITGDIAIHEGTVEPLGVTHIPQKYAGVKNYAQEHGQEKHLFLYVADPVGDEQPVKPGWDGNLEVKAFTSQDSIGAIIAELFEPAFNPEQEELFDRTPIALKAWDYVSTDVFEGMKRTALSKKWTGFFIHADGESGKSAMALELTRYLVAAERIYAPIWVRINNERLRECFTDKKQKPLAAFRPGQKREHQENPVTNYIAKLIAKALNYTWAPENGLSALANALKLDGNCPYLIIIDNLEVDEIDEVWESVQTIIGKCSPRPPVVLTSRIDAKIAGLTPIRPSELRLDEIEKLVENIARKQWELDYAQKLTAWKNNEKDYESFIAHLHNHFASFPGIITVIVPQLDRGLTAALQTLDNLKLFDKDVNKKAEAIYTTVFSHLDSFTQAVLFLFIRFTLPWVNYSSDDITITQKLCQTMIMFTSKGESVRFYFDGISQEPEEIEKRTYQAMRELADKHIINYDVSKNDYYIKTLAMEILITSESIKNAIIPVTCELTDDFFIFKKRAKKLYAGESLLSTLVGDKELIKICIYYHQSVYRLEKLLKKYCVNNFISGSDYFRKDYSLSRFAAQHADKPEYIKTFYDQGYTKIDKESILHYAAGNNSNKEVIKQIINCGADVSSQDEEERTPLHHAARYNENPEIIALLLEEGAKLDATNNDGKNPLLYIFDKDKEIPLHYAARNKNFEIFKRLAEEDIKLLNYPNSDGYTPLTNLVSCSSDQNIVSWLKEKDVDLSTTTHPAIGIPLLHWAAVNSDGTILKKLIEAGTKVDVTDNDGSTALHCAAMNPKLNSMNEDMITILLKKGLNIHETNKNGSTPLHFAADNNDPDSVALLLEKGAITDINAKAIDGITPLHLAAQRNENTDVIKLLIEKGAISDINAKIIDGGTPLYYAAGFNKNPDIIKLLIEKGADIFAQTKDGWYPIHCATENPEPAIIKVLIEAHQEREKTIDVTGNYSQTPLHCAALINENPEISIALIKAKARLDARDNTGKTALFYLKKRKDWRVIKKAIKKH